MIPGVVGLSFLLALGQGSMLSEGTIESMSEYPRSVWAASDVRSILGYPECRATQAREDLMTYSVTYLSVFWLREQ